MQKQTVIFLNAEDYLLATTTTYYFVIVGNEVTNFYK